MAIFSTPGAGGGSSYIVNWCRRRGSDPPRGKRRRARDSSRFGWKEA